MKANLNDRESDSRCNKMSGTDYEFCSEATISDKNVLM